MPIKKLFSALVLSFSVLAVVSGGHFLEFFKHQNQQLSHFLYRERALNPDILIVAVDDKTLAETSKGGLGNLGEWNAKTYSQTFARIIEGEPSSILVDILFDTPSSSLQRRDIAEILKEHTGVEDFTLQILSFLNENHPFDQVLADTFATFDRLYLIKAGFGEGAITETPQGEALSFQGSIEPMDLYKDLTLQGFANVSTSENSQNTSTIYAIPAYFEVNGVVEPHIDLKVAFEHLGKDVKVPTEEAQMLVNYGAPSYSYPMVSFSDVYYGKVNPDIFKGKIVLVGHTSYILQDRAFTPIDQKVPMPGVEIHANAISTILEGRFLSHQNGLGFVLFVGVLVLTSTLAFLLLPIWGAGLVFLLEIFLFPFYAEWRFMHGLILDLIWPMAGLLLCLLSALAYRYQTEFKEKRKLKQAFGHYVSDELVAEIGAHPEMLELGGKRQVLSILFLDIVNFTTVSESMSPQEVVGLVNTYFGALAKVILEFGGMVDKFEGDAIMALFGAPLPKENHAELACRAALTLQELVKALNVQTGKNLSIRVGVATGEAILGNMGSEERFDYTAMGDIVNTASRLEGGNKFYGTKILVHEATKAAASDFFAFRRIDSVRFKGKKEAVTVYELLGEPQGIALEFKDLLNRWEEALNFYREGKWEEAENLLHFVLEKVPQDGPAQAYLERIATLKKTPIQDWDGAWTFGEK